MKAIGKGVRRGLPAVREAIAARAVDSLPSRHGLGEWVAKTRVTATVRLRARSGTIRLKGGRNSAGARSDIKAIDAGRVRAPSWGRRYGNAWHNQAVTPGFFTETAAAAKDWHDDVDQAVDVALDQIRRG